MGPRSDERGWPAEKFAKLLEGLQWGRVRMNADGPGGVAVRDATRNRFNGAAFG